MFDSHTHSNHSHDGHHTVVQMCNEAINKNLKGIAITDHCETQNFKGYNTEMNLKNAFLDIENAKEIFYNKLQVGKGMEMAQSLFYPDLAKEVMEYTDYDFVLGSVHTPRKMKGFAKIDYSKQSEKEIHSIIRCYFEELYETAKLGYFDVLAHFTYPLRYINGTYKLGHDVSSCMDIVEELFRFIIKNNKGIEINVSGLYSEWGYAMPETDLLRLYKELGGEIVTIGSDAHYCQKVGSGIDRGYEMLKECGFHYVAFYQKRQPIMYKL